MLAPDHTHYTLHTLHHTSAVEVQNKEGLQCITIHHAIGYVRDLKAPHISVLESFYPFLRPLCVVCSVHCVMCKCVLWECGSGCMYMGMRVMYTTYTPLHYTILHPNTTLCHYTTLCHDTTPLYYTRTPLLHSPFAIYTICDSLVLLPV
jgi:hypothetical protein